MSLKLFAFLIALQGCILSVLSVAVQPACMTKRTPSIPACHVYHSKRKPLVIGHRGNPLKYQENTLAGFKSLRRTRADGFEVDVFLTKDKQLICFHDDNTLRLTGVSGSIVDMTLAQIQNLRYKKTILYGTRSYSYTKKRKIVLLKDVLKWAKRTDYLLFIELKPSNPILTTAAAVQHSIEIGTAAANMIKRYDMLNQAILISYDVLKLSTAKQIDSNIVIGTSYTAQLWSAPIIVYGASKLQFLRFYPSIAQCLNPLSTASNAYITSFYLSGILEKAIDSAYTDIEIDMYNNPVYGTTNTISSMQANYSRNIVIGGYTAYTMSAATSVHRRQGPILNKMIRQGVHIFVTDDICKMARKVRLYRPRPRFNRHRYYDASEEDEDDVDDEEEPAIDDEADIEREAYGEKEPDHDENEIEENSLN